MAEQTHSGRSPSLAAMDWHAVVLSLVLSAFYIVNSSGLIVFNGYLLDENRFPFAVPLTVLHMFVSSIFTCLLYKLQPALFPSLTDPRSKVELGLPLMKVLVPISLIFSVQIVLSNTALITGSVAFLQMMKAGNSVLTYGMALAFGLEVLDPLSVLIIACILGATVMTMEGQVDFAASAFFLQLTSQLFESSKLVLSQIALSNQKLDAMSYVLLTCPVTLVFLCMLIVVEMGVHQSTLLALPAWPDLVQWAPLLLADALVAVLLNVSMAFLMKHTSAMGVVLVNILKHAVTVLSGAVLLSEEVTAVQAVGFSMQMSFVVFWSYRKARVWADHKGEDARAPLGAAQDKLEQARPSYGAAEDSTSKVH
mmetsp:Transcript_6954/g.17788  ORF Transcript_6954/g.17788 Transcript_6954/m.17788 type:complete len:366 (-) Transcript_6954:59-1156(-)